MGSLTRLLLWRSTVSAHSSSGDFVCMEIKLSLGTSSMKDINFITHTGIYSCKEIPSWQWQICGAWRIGGGGVQTGEAGGQRWGLEWAIMESDPCSTPHKQRTLTGLRLPVLRFSFRQCDFSPSFSSSIHGMLINASVACLTATAELFCLAEKERGWGDYLRKVSLESCWEINHCSGKTIAVHVTLSASLHQMQHVWKKIQHTSNIQSKNTVNFFDYNYMFPWHPIPFHIVYYEYIIIVYTCSIPMIRHKLEIQQARIHL